MLALPLFLSPSPPLNLYPFCFDHYCSSRITRQGAGRDALYWEPLVSARPGATLWGDWRLLELEPAELWPLSRAGESSAASEGLGTWLAEQETELSSDEEQLELEQMDESEFWRERWRLFAAWPAPEAHSAEVAPLPDEAAAAAAAKLLAPS